MASLQVFLYANCLTTFFLLTGLFFLLKMFEGNDDEGDGEEEEEEKDGEGGGGER